MRSSGGPMCFWYTTAGCGGEDGRVTGVTARRGCNPCCAMTSISSAIICRLMGIPSSATTHNWPRVWAGSSMGASASRTSAGMATHAESMMLDELTRQIGNGLKRTPLVIGNGAKAIRHIAWCSGGAQSYFEQALALGVDAFVSGEISEQHVHLARESGVAYIAAGHHATERFGVQAWFGIWPTNLTSNVNSSISITPYESFRR